MEEWPWPHTHNEALATHGSRATGPTSPEGQDSYSYSHSMIIASIRSLQDSKFDSSYSVDHYFQYRLTIVDGWEQVTRL